MDAKEVVKVLESNGFVKVRSRGAHLFYKHLDGRKTVVPYHGHADISLKTLRSIEKATGLSLRG